MHFAFEWSGRELHKERFLIEEHFGGSGGDGLAHYPFPVRNDLLLLVSMLQVFLFKKSLKGITETFDWVFFHGISGRTSVLGSKVA